MSKIEVQFSEKELDMLKMFIIGLGQDKDVRSNFRMTKEETLDLSNKIGYLYFESRKGKNIYASSFFRKIKA